MWGLLPLKTQVLIIGGMAIALAWAIEGAAGLLTGNAPSELKLISLVVTIISIGIVGVALRDACAEGMPPAATITSILRLTKSAAKAGSRS